MYFSSTRGVLPYVSHTGMCRAFHKLLEIFQTVSRDFSRSCSKNNQKLLFVTKVAQKLLEKKKLVYGLVLKYANCTTKVRFLSILCAILRRNQRC